MGSRLSGGEAQRVALARAFLKNAPLILLDEPTAHLDPDLEMSLNEATEMLLKNKTVITIAHRYSTLRGVDQVIVLRGGRVVQTGFPGEILQPERNLTAVLTGKGEHA
jgi:ABC-type transport system involved in cytochrome bd biosynthesis fused ATPase/permease subunit